MKVSDIFTIIMLYFMVFFSGGDFVYLVVMGAFTRIGYIRLLEEEAKPDGFLSTPKKEDPLVEYETEEMRDGVKEE